MSLSEVEFAFFFPLFFLIYWLLPRRAWAQNALIALGSLLFYATWSLKLLPLFLVSTAIDFGVLRGFARTAAPEAEGEEDPARAAQRTSRRRALFFVGLANNVLALLWFKYVGFFADSLNHLLGALGLGASLPVLRLALPLGISFYTMARVGVLIDAYYERIAPPKSPLVWLCFVSFFQ